MAAPEIPQPICPFCGCDDERVEALVTTKRSIAMACGNCSKTWSIPKEGA